MKYLDLTGLGEVWANIKSYISSKIPTKTSQLQNDSNYATTSQLPSKTSQLTNDSGFLTSTDISNKADKATTLSGYGITDAYTKTQVDKKVSDLVNSAPETLDTLNELASALGNDPNFATTVANQIGTKANDSDVVHKTGNETIKGIKNFYNVFLGEEDGVIRIGQNVEGTLFCKLYYDGRIYNNSKQFIPQTNNEYNLGAPNNKWKDIYATTFNGKIPAYADDLALKANIADTVLKTYTDYTFRNYDLNSLNIDEKYNENYAVAISEDGHGTRPVGCWRWTNVINFCTNHFLTQLCIPIHPNKDFDCMYIRTRWSSDSAWGEWRKSANDNSIVHKSGDETINGVKTFTGEIVNTIPNTFRHVYGNYGTFWRNDGEYLYLLLTNSGNQYGDWNNFRPLTVNLATGICSINGTAGGVAWTNVSGRPTKVSQFTNDSGYLTSGNVVDRTSNQSINGEKTFNNVIQTNSGLYTKDNICLRIQNIDNNETNPPGEIGSCAIGFTNKDASAWWAYNRYIRTAADGTAYLNLLCHPIKKSDGSYTVGGYINIYNTGFARVNDPLSIDPNATWNNNNIVTSNWVRKYFSNSIGNYWSKSATGTQYSRSSFSYLSTIDKATTNTSRSIYRPFRVVDKDNSIEVSFVECGYNSDLAYTSLATQHSNGGWLAFAIHSNGVAYLDNCRELGLVNKNLNSYNTPPSNEVDTQLWFMDKDSNKYATLQTDYFPNGTRQIALTHKSLRTNNWIGLNMLTSPTDDVIACQPRFQAKDGLIVQNEDPNAFTQIVPGWIEMSNPNHSGIDFKHAGNQDYLGRIALNPDNILFLETINGAPIMANGKNIVRSVNGVNADNNGNVSIQGLSNGIGEIIQGYYVPSGIVQKSGSVYFGTLVQPNPGATLNDFRDINITITNEFYPEVGKIYDYSQIFSTLYLHSYDSEYAVGATFDSDSPKIDKWFGGWAKVAGRNLVRNSGKYLCTSVSSYGYAVTLRYNLTMTCTMISVPGGSRPKYTCKIVSKTVPQNQMTVTAKATFMRVG